MKKEIISIVSNENGSAIVITVLVLAALTILGISASNTSNTEIMLANNEMLYKQNLYKAEAAAMEGAQTLENEPTANLLAFTPLWLNQNGVNMTDLSLWDYDGQGGNDNANMGILANTVFAVVFNKIALGSSLDLTASTLLREFSVYGFSRPGTNSNFIEIGYKRRY
jgi:hypothetical protein